MRSSDFPTAVGPKTTTTERVLSGVRVAITERDSTSARISCSTVPKCIPPKDVGQSLQTVPRLHTALHGSLWTRFSYIFYLSRTT